MTARTLAREIAKAASDTKANDIVVLDLRKITSVADYFVICSGISDRQVQAIADAICERGKERKRRPLGKEGEDSQHWILVDYGDVVAHIFHQTERDFYHIERLWSDAKKVGIKGITSQNGHRR